MALSIKNEEADRLARELTAVTGESLTEVVVAALRERLERLQRAQRPGIGERLRKLAAEAANHDVVDPRTPDELLGYDEHGLPV